LRHVVGGRADLDPGQTEVEHPQASLAVDHDVGRFQVAVDDAALVSRPQGIGQGDRQLEQPLGGEALLGDQLVQAVSLDMGHGEEVNPVRLLDREDGDDIRVIEGGQGPGLPLQALQTVGIAGQIGRQDLERHPALELGVLGQVDLPHPAGAQPGSDPVVGELFADQLAL
jgi:hypothetical protein